MAGYLEQFSDCGLYRYRFEQALGSSREICAFILLNPATPPGVQRSDHQTRDRCYKFAASDRRYGTFVVVNLFAYREPERRKLRTIGDPVGPDNDRAIERAAREVAERGGSLICAWGNDGLLHDRDLDVMALLARLPVEPMAFAVTMEGAPHHPSRLPAPLVLRPYRGRKGPTAGPSPSPKR
jgi:hypothetical protein